RSRCAVPAAKAARRCGSHAAAPSTARAGDSQRAQTEGTEARQSTSIVLNGSVGNASSGGAVPRNHSHWLSCRGQVQPKHIATQPAPQPYFTISGIVSSSVTFRPSPRFRGSSQPCLADPGKTLNVCRTFTDTQ